MTSQNCDLSLRLHSPGSAYSHKIVTWNARIRCEEHSFVTCCQRLIRRKDLAHSHHQYIALGRTPDLRANQPLLRRAIIAGGRGSVPAHSSVGGGGAELAAPPSGEVGRRATPAGSFHFSLTPFHLGDSAHQRRAAPTRKQSAAEYNPALRLTKARPAR